MSTAGDIARGLDLGFRIGKWAVDTIIKFVNGDNSEPVKRLADILPPELKADVEHARQYELTRKSLEEDPNVD